MNILSILGTFLQVSSGYATYSNGSVGYDYSYLILFAAIAIVSYIVQWNLQSNFKRFSQMLQYLTSSNTGCKILMCLYNFC